MVQDSAARPRGRLTRARVVRAGVDLADSDGLSSLTMRSLGAALGVEAMALYKHVAGKDDLLDGMVDLVLAEMAPPVPGKPWRAQLRAASISMWQTLLRHPWACQLRLSGGGATGPAGLHHTDAVLGTLREGGFSVEMTHRAFHVLDIYVHGFALGTISFPIDRADMRHAAEVFLQSLPAGEYPFLVEHINFHIESDVLSEGDFEFGLDLLLDSLQRLRR